MWYRKRQPKKLVAPIVLSEASKIFLKAILVTDYEECTKQLKAGADINTKFGECALSDHDAISTCGPSDTPLSYAVRNGYDHLAKFLLENKADVELYFKGKTPLMIAAGNLNVQLVELLLRFRANPNAINTPQNVYHTELTNLTAMHYVFLGIHEWLVISEKELCLRIAGLLIKHGFTGKYEQILPQLTKIPEESGRHVILKVFEEVWAALKLGKPSLEIKKTTSGGKQEGTPLLLKDKELKKTKLIDKASEGDVGAVKELIEAKADLEQTNEFGVTALSVASRYGKLDVVKLLLDQKADIEHIDKEEDTPLSEAITERRLEVIKTLIDAKANVNRLCRNGDSALILATLSAAPESVQLLLEKKAELNQINDEGDTALSLARSQHYPRITAILEEEAKRREIVMKIEDQVAKKFNVNGSISLFWQCAKKLAQLTDGEQIPDELKSREDIMEAVHAAELFIHH